MPRFCRVVVQPLREGEGDGCSTGREFEPVNRKGVQVLAAPPRAARGRPSARRKLRKHGVWRNRRARATGGEQLVGYAHGHGEVAPERWDAMAAARAWRGNLGAILAGIDARASCAQRGFHVGANAENYDRELAEMVARSCRPRPPPEGVGPQADHTRDCRSRARAAGFHRNGRAPRNEQLTSVRIGTA